MKNQYFGNVNDWRKYYILRRLHAAALRLTVGWMLTSDDGSNDGKHRGYLRERRECRSADPDLFDWLSEWHAAGARADVSLIEISGLFHDARFHADLLDDSIASRQVWFDQLATIAAGTDLIFLDPDNGLEIKTVARGRKRSSKYVHWREIEKLLALGFSVMVYQHTPRMEPGRSVAMRLDEAFANLPIDECHSIRTPSVNYFVFPAGNARPQLLEGVRACTDLDRMGIDYRSTTREQWTSGLNVPLARILGTLPPPPPPTPAIAARLSIQTRSRPAGYSTSVGFINPKRQRVLARTDLPGTDHGQRVYILGCGNCGEEYGANGSDISQRNCPKCQQGLPGLPFRVN